MIEAATVAQIKALTTLSGAVYLYEAGRGGAFAWNSADLSAEVTADSGEGIYIPPDSDPTGASGAWVRQFDDGFAPGSWFGLSVDGTTDDAAKINAALSLSAVRELRLGAGTFATDAVIILPTDKTLSGSGRDITILKRLPYALPLGDPSRVIDAAPGTANTVVRDMTVNVNRAGNGGVLTDRCNGLTINSKNFLIERVYVENATGYAVWNNGTSGDPMSGVVRDVECWNFNVGFEQTGVSAGIEFQNCRAHAAPRDGGSVVSYGVEACFHQYDGAGKLRFIDCSADGDTYGFYPLLNSAHIDTIDLIGCRFDMTGSGSAVVVAATGAFNLTNFRAVNCRFSGTTPSSGSVVSFKRTTAYFANCSFNVSGGVATVGVYLESSDLHFSGCHVDVVGPTSGSTVWAVYANTGMAKWDGGTLKVRGPSAQEHASAGLVRISSDTKVTRVTANLSFYWPISDLNGSLTFAFMPPAYVSEAAAIADTRPNGFVFYNSTVGALDMVRP